MSEKTFGKKKNRLQRWEERKERSKLTKEVLEKQIEDVNKLRIQLHNDGVKPEFTKFSDLPISERTMLGLERGNFKKMTLIQSEAIPLAITGHDILGAAKTGSGKTLTFLIPTLERLLMEKWDSDLGVGALILTPTRELALQIFKVLQVVGYKHVFSAALLTGGRDVTEEKKRLQKISIVVATPGRLVQHLKEGTNISLDNLQVFVMDEADRLLDMGFQEDLNTIVEYLPESRQTLLFSATQTNDLKALAALSLKDPQYVSAHAASATPTPSRMCQNFIILDLHHKLDALMTFIRRHPNDKIVVFANTCNQVRYMYLAFTKILKKYRIPSMCLTGKMTQFRREEVFLTYCRCKSAVLFCTDIAARGLDFPLIHYVIQYDCPDSAQTYIHRAGRTARCGTKGVSILFLTPTETPMLSFLAKKNIPLREIAIKGHVLNDSHEQFAAAVLQGLKYDAQKAFISYLRSVYFAANKLVFDIKSINTEDFSKSLGLLTVPNMNELSNLQRGAKNIPWDVFNYMKNKAASTGGNAKSTEEDADRQLTRKERHLKASDMARTLEQHQRFATGSGLAAFNDAEDDRDEDLFTVVKKTDNKNSGVATRSDLTFDEQMSGISKNKRKKLLEAADLRIRDLGMSKKIKFTEDNSGSDEDEAAAIQSRIEEMSREARKEIGEDTLEETVDENEYAAKLANEIREHAEEDKKRAKNIRKERKLKKEGKLYPHEGEAHVQAVLASDNDYSDVESFDEETEHDEHVEEQTVNKRPRESDTNEDKRNDGPSSAVAQLRAMGFSFKEDEVPAQEIDASRKKKKMKV